VKKLFIGIALAVSMSACSKTEQADKSSATSESSGSSAQIEKSTTGLRLSREPALNAAPLGIEIGFANLAGVKQKLGGMTNLSESGTSNVTGGKIISSDGQGLGIDGLSKFIVIFDKNETLVAVIMSLPKNVNDTYSKLKEKYKPISSNIDEFMGNGTATLEKGDSLIVIEAAHLSFAMDVVYATKEFMAAAKHNSNEASAKKEQEQKDRF